MRITQTMIQRSALTNLQGGLRQVASAQQQVSTGLRIQKPSDDPVGSAQVMQAGGSLRALEQFRRNIGAAQGRADAEESALGSLTDILSRAKELAIAQASGTADASTRSITKAEVDGLLQQVATLGNTRFGNLYLFGGAHADQPPVAASGSPPVLGVNPAITPGQLQTTEIAAGQFLRPNHDAAEIFGGANGPLDALTRLSDALGNNDPDAIRTAIDGLDSSFDRVQGLIGDIGARSNHLRVSAANLETLDVNLRTIKSDLEEVDFERAVTDLLTRQTAMQAAMMATSRIMGMTLTDYLR